VKRLRYFLENGVLKTAVVVIPLIPRRLLILTAKVVGALAWVLDARGRRTAEQNLRAAFGGQFTPAERRRIARRSYQNFARTFLDLFWAVKLNPGNWSDHVSIEAQDPGAEELARECGALWVTPHFGNFEIGSLVWGYRGFKLVVVAQDFKNSSLTGLFKRLREHSGHDVIPQRGSMLRLMKNLRRKGHAALLTDLTIKPNRGAAVIECFGLKTCVTTLHASLARRLGLLIVPAVCIPSEDGRYMVRTFTPVRPGEDEDDAAVAQRVWDCFEQAIREQPHLWMWMYKHWRYLPGEDKNQAYPEYANPSKAFRKLLAADGNKKNPSPAGLGS
jgi:KDO2-lipid IV(A) lauroyltransferase